MAKLTQRRGRGRGQHRGRGRGRTQRGGDDPIAPPIPVFGGRGRGSRRGRTQRGGYRYLYSPTTLQPDS